MEFATRIVCPSNLLQSSIQPFHLLEKQQQQYSLSALIKMSQIHKVSRKPLLLAYTKYERWCII